VAFTDAAVELSVEFEVEFNFVLEEENRFRSCDKTFDIEAMLNF
jgi:hypothetical protein